jgi:predicted O-linked N-acetylglucosamine transferase (SPINDLY family)
MKKISRNDPCPCGSGKKYKQCCLKNEDVLASGKLAPTLVISGALQEAIEHHQSGRLPQAETLYRQILQVEPDHPEALHLLGVVAHQAGRNETAVELIDKAIKVDPSIPYYYSNLGSALQAQGKLEAAADSYRHALKLKPDYAEAHYNLGTACKDQGELNLAMEHYNKALLYKPGYAEAHYHLGLVLQQQRKLGESIGHYRKALEIKPDWVDVHCDLGRVLHDTGQLDDSVASFRRVLDINPCHYKGYNYLGEVFEDQGNLPAAVECYSKAITLKPDFVEAHNNLGNALKAQGALVKAIEHHNIALMLRPDLAEVHYNLGNSFKEQGQLNQAIESYLKAISINPDYAEAYSNLGLALQAQGKLDQAIASELAALSLDPTLAAVHNNLGDAYKTKGKLQAASESYQRALVIQPDYAEAYSNLLFLYSYHAMNTPQEYLACARNWEQNCVSSSERMIARKRIIANPVQVGRRLKLGYVSGDFRQHAVSYFIEQLFGHHDKSKIELFAYSTIGHQDGVTKRLQALVEHWIPLSGVSDAAARDRIEEDQIDVLIDLSGHTAHNRLGIFARRAAPVQAHYLGYFASTGLTEMDYWIGDEILTPTTTDNHFSEQVWRLPRVWVCYDGKADAPVANWRLSQDGTVRLGSFNNLGKLSPETLALWAKVLHALPEGKLLLKTKELADPGNRQRILDALSSLGISPDRIELQDSNATPDWSAHMAYYNRVDIALDPVGAVGGGTTTCDALWMGVPVIALEGDRMASRMTASMLNAIERPEWIAHSEAEYIDKVVAVARDVEHRKAIRPAQRARMANSPLCDGVGLAKSLEQVYFDMKIHKDQTA